MRSWWILIGTVALGFGIGQMLINDLQALESGGGTGNFFVENWLLLSFGVGSLLFGFVTWQILRPTTDQRFGKADAPEARDDDAAPASHLCLRDRFVNWIFKQLLSSGLVRLSERHVTVVGKPVGKRRVYGSIDELPPEVRKLVEQQLAEGTTEAIYESTGGDDIPDGSRSKLEELRSSGAGVVFEDHTTGQRYECRSWDEVPEDVRARIEELHERAEDTGQVYSETCVAPVVKTTISIRRE